MMCESATISEFVENDQNNSMEREIITVVNSHDIENCITELSLENPVIEKPRRGRKRKWPMSRLERKVNRNSNLPYLTESGKLVQPREFRDFECSCSTCPPIPVNKRKREEIFRKFWSLGSYDAQTAFLIEAVLEHPIKRKRNPNSKKREFTRVYTLEGWEVCRRTFLQTLQISGGRVNTALKRNRNSSKFSKRDSTRILEAEVTSEDTAEENTDDVDILIVSPNDTASGSCLNPAILSKRGTVSGGRTKLPKKVVRDVRQHIKSLSTHSSDYSEEERDTKYLPEHLTITSMYKLFKEKYPDVKCSLSSYRNILIKYFNVRKKTRSDSRDEDIDTLSVKELEFDDPNELLEHVVIIESIEEEILTIVED